MDFAHSPVTLDYAARVQRFLDECIYPNEDLYWAQAEPPGDPWHDPPVMDDLKAEARRRGLWNLWLAERTPRWGGGLSNLEYAPLAELSGRSPFIAPEAMNCSAPDTGNMELLAMFGTDEQQEQWLRPLLDGDIRSCFSMTEPDVASSDASNISTRIERDGDELVVTGRKWWSSGAMSKRCRLAVLMGVSDPGADRHHRHSMVLVPLHLPGVRIQRSTKVLGFADGPHGGHAVIDFDHVRVPVTNLLGEPGAGFAMAQARLGPGRIHHCMRLLGMAERSFDLMCERAHARSAFGKTLAEQGVVRDAVAEARIRIEEARLLVLKTAWLIDTVGAQGAAVEISAIKVSVPRSAAVIIDQAIQVWGGAGLSQDTPLAGLYEEARLLRIADGPDDVHKMVLARRELARYRRVAAAETSGPVRGEVDHDA